MAVVESRKLESELFFLKNMLNRIDYNKNLLVTFLIII